MEIKKITIQDYIEDNHKLLSTLGVFLALTVFYLNIDIKLFAPWFSFLSLSCVVLIWLELWSNFPKEKGTWKLSMFENVLSYLAFISIIYWVVKFQTLYQDAIKLLIVLLIAIVSLTIISRIFKKTNLFNKLFRAHPENKKIIRYIFGIVLLITILLISSNIVELFSPFIDNLIKQIKELK